MGRLWWLTACAAAAAQARAASGNTTRARQAAQDDARVVDAYGGRSQKELLQDMLHRRSSLRDEQRRPTSLWVQSLIPARSTLVQVGANDHSANYVNADPGPACVARGWRSVLLEPEPRLFERLSRRYAGRPAHHPRLVNAAICGEGCAARANRTFWSVDASNATGSWGSEYADGRCVAHTAKWVQEIASLSRQHLLRSGGALAFSPSNCAKCAKALGRPLPPTCMKNLVRDNLKRSEVACGCLSAEPAHGRDVNRVALPRTVTLLVIDAEGYDGEVLQHYPFRARPPTRVVYESTHLGQSGINRAAALLMGFGYVNILGGLGRVPFAVWHHPNGSQSVNASWRPPAARRGRAAGKK